MRGSRRGLIIIIILCNFQDVEIANKAMTAQSMVIELIKEQLSTHTGMYAGLSKKENQA